MEHVSIEENDEPMGELIALGTSYLFYTTNPKLSPLDGHRYSSVAEARQAIRTQLAGVTMPPSALG